MTIDQKIKTSDCAKMAFMGVILLVALNSFYNLVMTLLDYPWPYTSFLYRPWDQFGDMIKLAMSMPGANQPFESLPKILRNWNDPLFNPYLVDKFKNIGFPPVFLLFYTCYVKILNLIGPMSTAILVSLFWLSAFIVLIAVVAKKNRLFCILTFTFSYPTLFCLDRGNIAMAVCFFILLFLYFVFINNNYIVAALALAVAINIKIFPVIFLFVLFSPQCGNRVRTVLLTILFTLVLFLASAELCSAIYPQYSIELFLAAAKRFHSSYAITRQALYYNSSLFVPLALLFGYSKIVEYIPIAALGLIALYFLYLARKKAFKPSAYIFLAAVIFSIAPQNVADYYLMVMMFPLLWLSEQAGDEPLGKSDLLLVATCVFALAPKHYVFFKKIIVYDSYSLQTILNPVIIFLLILAYAYYIGKEKVGDA